MKNVLKRGALVGVGAFVVLASCTKLEENLNSTATQAQASTFLGATADLNVLIQSCYDGLQIFQNQDGPTSLMENSSDESLVPTRGGDWDDNGVWRVIHNHTWNADHQQVQNVFNGLLGIVFNTTNVLTFTSISTAANKDQIAAEARFIRAFAMFTVLDLYGQVPFRQPGEDLRNPPTVLSGTAAADFILSELTAIRTNLPNSTGVPSAKRATKDAADVLMMKVLLQKGTYANRATPTFAAADMAQVITLATGIMNSGRYSLATNVFDNYARNNDAISTENIFTNENQGSSRGGNVRSSWYKGSHYNQNKSGWNGFTTLADVYDKFEAADQRRGVVYPTGVAGLPNPGNRINAGFLIGQQYNLANDAALNDRRGNPLAFTRTVALQESGANLEVTGIRVNRYPVDYVSSDDQADNDYVFFRYADVVLMRAEAEMRSGNTAAALVNVNNLRTRRGATPLASLTAANMLDERQREFYWDGWRRMDQIRFGTFLAARTLKPNVSDPKFLYFPIPNSALAVNPNLRQNPGY
ncbi:MAG: RagB/SusD family nutrient uptake outer membrane protein [Bacteroidetes bacterium]|nr:MAG: RagB/SusD family nutrient uptake outer membrane protein [Bacteroidota bacterium]TAE69394.1 MAG: RagB/SusD family nutrient uptake outer membrane protein [Bacteroidota bacterium]